MRTDYSMWINSLNWQHLRCKDPRPNPDIKTLLMDHVCQPQHNFSCSQSTENNSLVRSVLKSWNFLPEVFLFHYPIDSCIVHDQNDWIIFVVFFILLIMLKIYVLAFSSHITSSSNFFWRLEFQSIYHNKICFSWSCLSWCSKERRLRILNLT